jgi:ElaB/YqjD/DUF883 family membrane-anchored ribosome-binding protein
MAHTDDNIQQEIADTQREINDTRLAMTEKLELLGERVQETVEGAQASVEGMVETVKDTVGTTVAAVKQTVEGAQASMEGIVENVKGTVGETVATVQRTFDLHHQMEQHPWLLLGGSVAVGYLLGSGENGHTVAVGPAYEPRFSPTSRPAEQSRESSASLPPPQRMRSSIQEQFKDEIATLKSAAVGAVMSTLLAVLKQALPSSMRPRASTKIQEGNPFSDPSALKDTTIAATPINGTNMF